MFTMSKLYRVFSVFFLFIMMVAFVFADTLRLKDGSIIKGKIVSFENGKFTVLIDDGIKQRTLTFNSAEIDSIIFDSPSLPLESSNSVPNKETIGNSTIITVGNPKIPVSGNSEPEITDTPKTDPPKIVVNEKSTPSTQAPSKTITVASKPITINISVLADNTTNGWTNTGWVVRKGQKIRIAGKGRVSLGNGRYSTPTGISTLPDADKLIKGQPTGGLIAVIGADNNDFIFVGNSIEFTAVRDGDLFLGINEGNLNDNSGTFDVTVEIDPASEE